MRTHAIPFLSIINFFSTTLMSQKRALITGVTGQDGAYLSELLLEKGYEVHGLVRRASTFNTTRIDHLIADIDEVSPRFITHNADLTDSMSLLKVIESIQPNEIYNLGAQSHVGFSFSASEFTFDVNATGTFRLLEACRAVLTADSYRFYQASTSEIYGGQQNSALDENSEFNPRSPYAIAKLASYYAVQMYRNAYDIFASNGILFNHESPRRGETFVTRKITRGLSLILHGKQQSLHLGNLDSTRDWGHAKDYVEAQWLILQHKQPDDFVIATGVTSTVRDFLNICFDKLNITINVVGKGLSEKWYVDDYDSDQWPNISKGQCILKIHERFFRPLEVDYLLGDSSKALEQLGWTPTYNLSDLVDDMLKTDIQALKATR